MTALQLLIVAISGVVVVGVLGAFVIAYRRTSGPSRPSRSWRSSVSRETRKADRSAIPSRLVVRRPEPAPEPEPVVAEVPDEPEMSPAPVAVQTVEVVERQSIPAGLEGCTVPALKPAACRAFAVDRKAGAAIRQQQIARGPGDRMSTGAAQDFRCLVGEAGG